MKTISVGRLDPNTLVEHEGQLYRRVYQATEGRWAHLWTFLKSPQFTELMDRKWFVRHDLSHPFLQNGECYIPVERIKQFNPPELWTRNQKVDALKLIARINQFLEPVGWQLADCHLNNVTFRYSEPIYVDLGSLSSIQRDMAFNHFVNAASTHLGVTMPLSWSESLKILDGLKFDYTPTEWDDYDRTQEPKTRDEIQPKTAEHKLILGWLKDNQTMFDVGSNRGKFSRLAAMAGLDVIALDVSEFCVDVNWRIARRLQLPITALFGVFDRLINTAQWHCKDLACDVMLASSITHHLWRTGLNWWDQENLFRRFTRKWLLLEYVAADDPAILSWKLQGRYLQHMFEAAFSDWEIVEKAHPERETRTWYRMRKA